nr:hypothetical protein [uncultured Methanoregula sp.]
MMAEKICSDYTRYRLLTGNDAYTTGIAHEQGERGTSCAPIIDAEKGNEALRMVALIRGRTGSGSMASAE